MNTFGGNWTEQKIQLVEGYAKAYLTIMNKYPSFKLLYFDGFAGSGEIKVVKNKKQQNTPQLLEIETPSDKAIEGAAKRVVAIKQPKPFDMYYFVELAKKKADSLREILAKETTSEVHVVSEDCNVKLKSLASFLKEPKGKNFKVLAFIDPCGMHVEWEAIEKLKGLSVDMWILVPTGLGANRLLKKDKKIPLDWVKRLESFFGMTSEQLLPSFYSETSYQNLFGEQIITTKKNSKAIDKITSVYMDKMKTIFKYSSQPYVMKNSANSIMFHFFMASNNKSAVKIADDMIKRIK